MSGTLRKVQIEQYGGYPQLKLVEFNPSPPAADEVQISVHAAGVNYADCIVRMGLYRSARKYVGLPITPGFEVSGVVVEVGEAVKDVKVGDVVMAATRFGGYCERINVKAHYVLPKPSGYSFEQAAGLLATYLTAYYALYELVHPKEGQSILIHSAAGGVGMVLVQLAHAFGMEVTGVVGTSAKVPILEAFGPAHIIDKSAIDLWEQARKIAPNGYHVICDPNGASTLGESHRHLATPGKLVIYGFASMLPKSGGRANWFKLVRGYFKTPTFNPLTLTTKSHSILAFNLSYLFDEVAVFRDAARELESLFDRGALKPPQVTTFPIEQVREAHQAIESGSTTGKLVLTFS